MKTANIKIPIKLYNAVKALQKNCAEHDKCDGCCFDITKYSDTLAPCLLNQLPEDYLEFPEALLDLKRKGKENAKV